MVRRGLGGGRAAVGASLRLRRSRSAARAREASAREELGRRLTETIGGRPQSAVESLSWRSRKKSASTQLELELEADANEDIARSLTVARVPARGTHPGAPANNSRRSRAARSVPRPSTAPNAGASIGIGIGVRRASPSLEPLSVPSASTVVDEMAPVDSGRTELAAPVDNSRHPSPDVSDSGSPDEDDRTERLPQADWSTAPRIRQRRLRQELLQAVEEGATNEVDALLRFGTPVRGTHDDHLDSSLLHTAALFGYEQICKLLIEHGAEVNAVDAELETPLMWAAKWGHPEICRLLLENGALLHLKCTHGETARQKAEHGSHSAVCEAMRSFEDASKAFVQKIFLEIDTDGSGMIDQEELAEYVLQQREDNSLVLGKMEQELASLKSKLAEESDRHLGAQEQLAEVSAAYEKAAESAQWWEERHTASASELAELRDALQRADQRASRLAEKNAKHDSIVNEVQASAQIALKAASHAVASVLDRRGTHAGVNATSTSASTVANSGCQNQRQTTIESSLPIKPALSEGRRWSVSAGGPSGAGSGVKRPCSAEGEEWQAIAGFIQHGRRALPLPAGLLQTIMEQLDEVLRWIAQGGADDQLKGVSRSHSQSQRVLSPTASKHRKKKKVYTIDKVGTWKSKGKSRSKSPTSSSSHSTSPDADDSVLPWIVERLSQAQAAGKSLRCLLEEADIDLPVRVQETQSRQLERLERKHEQLNAALLESKAVSERWTARALAAEARAARAEATATELKKRMETGQAELQLVKQQKRAAVGAEVQRQRKLEEQLSMQAERVRLANLRARAVSQMRIAETSGRTNDTEDGVQQTSQQARSTLSAQGSCDGDRSAAVDTSEEPRRSSDSSVWASAGRRLLQLD